MITIPKNPNLSDFVNKTGYKVTNIKFNTEYSMTFSIDSVSPFDKLIYDSNARNQQG
jgi:hypothetical protein